MVGLIATSIDSMVSYIEYQHLSPYSQNVNAFKTPNHATSHSDHEIIYSKPT